MLGEFFGLTGVSATMLDLNVPRFQKLCTMLNNGLDVFRLTKFKKELEYLKYFLHETVKVEYNDPEIKKIVRKANFIRNNSVDQLKRMYKLDISEMDGQQRTELVEKIMKEAEDLAKNRGVGKTVVNSFKIYNKETKVSLGEYELLVLSNFSRNLLPVIERYYKTAITGNFEESTIFGKRLHEIASRPPKYLLSVVESLFVQPGVDTQFLADQCLEWSQILRSHFVSQSELDNEADQRSLETHFEMSSNFVSYVFGLEGLNSSTSNFEELSSERRELLEIFDEESKEFYDVMNSLISRRLIDKKSITTLVDLYFMSFRLDYDKEFICELLFPEGSGVSLDFAEIDSVYANLNNVGFFCFSRLNSKMFVQSLGKVSFSTETRTVIDPDVVVDRYSFARVIEDIEYLCYSIRPIGSRLEEVV